MRKQTTTAEIDRISKNQVPHSRSLIAYQNNLDHILDELLKLNDEKRKDYIHFNFIRLVNGTLALENAYKNSGVGMSKIGKKSKFYISLGFSFVKSSLIENKTEIKKKYPEGLFSNFDFIDLYKIGYSLIDQFHKNINKSLSDTNFKEQENEYFLGSYFEQFIENAFLEGPKIRKKDSSETSTFKEIQSIEDFEILKKEGRLFSQSLPFVDKFFETMKKMKDEDIVQDSFYLNYEVEAIDFEAIIISSFINYTNGSFDQKNNKKMGITIDEFLKFLSAVFPENETTVNFHSLANDDHRLSGFISKFGLDSIENFSCYLKSILSEHLDGYTFFDLSRDDFKHIGGPIFLA